MGGRKKFVRRGDGLDAHDVCVKTGKRQKVRSEVEAREDADLRNGAVGCCRQTMSTILPGG